MYLENVNFLMISTIGTYISELYVCSYISKYVR